MKLSASKDPYLELGPFKLEIASSLPFITVVHDILTEEERKQHEHPEPLELLISKYLCDFFKIGLHQDCFWGPTYMCEI